MPRIAHNRTEILWQYAEKIENSSFIYLGETEKKNGRRRILCKCECGNVSDYDLTAIKSNHTKACSECRVRKASIAKVTHGHCTGKRTTTYKTWLDMKTRCTSQNHRDFHNYGGRGIKVCDRWLTSFDNFLSDMGEKPDSTYTIERVDVNGNYEPDNCIWLPKKEQWKNRRRGGIK